MASPHVYAISKRAQQVLGDNALLPLISHGAVCSLLPCNLHPLRPLAPPCAVHIPQYPLTYPYVRSQAFEATLALSDEAKKEAAAEGAFVDQSVLL